MKRDQFKEENPYHYYPDGYIYVVLRRYVITTPLVAMVYWLRFGNLNWVSVLAVAFLLVVVPFSIAFIITKRIKDIRKYDPASKYFVPEEKNKTPHDNGVL